MQVIISVGGKFHAFYLAQQLLKRGYLRQLITYPQFFISDSFDRIAAKKVKKADIFVGWSSFSLHSLRKAKELGATTIVERGSSHIEYQQEILKEEYDKFGLKFKGAHPRIVEKELEEYKEAEYISIPSLFVKKTFLKKGIPEAKLIHVPYGVDLGEFKQVPKEDNVFRVIYVGAMSLQKGVHYLLQAFFELKLPKSELLLIGKMNNEMKQFFRKYEGNYRWIGHKPKKELYRYYSQGSVFVMPSIQEGLAMVQVQAMACGLPIICTTNTGGEDLIENGKEGFIIPIRNVEKLKEKILFFYENPKECYEMGQAAKRKVQKGFTWDDYGERMIREYQRILSKSV